MDSSTYSLHGDNFTADQIALWFEEERDASVELSGVDFPFYYSGLNNLHAWDRIEARLGTVLAIGCGNGKELEQIAARVDRFLCVEGPFNRRWIAVLDALACRLLAWNIRYERPSLFSKIAPGDVAMVLRKP